VKKEEGERCLLLPACWFAGCLDGWMDSCGGGRRRRGAFYRKGEEGDGGRRREKAEATPVWTTVDE